jgi:methylmalonyl-CoA/ethylmalonyl-CoA epimerase
VETYSLLLQKKPELTKEVAEQQVRVAIFRSSGEGPSIELLEPLGNESPVGRFLEKRGEGIHHICIYVSGIEAVLKRLKEKGVRLIDETPRVGAEGHKIAFIHPSSFSGVLIELEEK